MTLQERLEVMQARLQEQRNNLINVQRLVFQLEGAVLAIQEIMAGANGTGEASNDVEATSSPERSVSS